MSLQSEHVDCLMYADDIVLISYSSEGLQQRLHKLEKFCSDWCLRVNIKKTKVIIFNKAGRKINIKLTYQQKVLDCVSSYKYLGTHFTASGSFYVSKNDLYQKALKAFFKLKKDFICMNPSVKTSMHIFDHTLKPIILYNAEIWGSYNVSFKKLNNNDFDPDNFFKSLQCEKLHLKFSKSILGVHKRSVNFAVLSELGRYPLHYDILKCLIRYWFRLENLDSFPLLKDAYACCKTIHDNNKLSWYSLVKKALDYLNINLESKNYGPYAFKNFLKKKIQIKYSAEWYKSQNKLKDGKLQTFLKIKNNFGFENYLQETKKFEIRKAICKLRISSHKLMIEVGRHNNIPRTERYCKKCNTGEIEDETHFLIDCNHFQQEREILFSFIEKENKNFESLNSEQKLIFLLTSEDPIVLNAVGEFIFKYL